MFKVMGGDEGRQPCSMCWEGVRGVSHVQCVGRGWGASAMLKVLGGGEGRQPCSMCWEGVRGVTQVEGGGRGDGRHPCWRWCEGVRGISHVEGGGRWWKGVRGVTHAQGDRAEGVCFVYYKNSVSPVSSITHVTGTQFRQFCRLQEPTFVSFVDYRKSVLFRLFRLSITGNPSFVSFMY